MFDAEEESIIQQPIWHSSVEGFNEVFCAGSMAIGPNDHNWDAYLTKYYTLSDAEITQSNVEGASG